MVLQGWAPRTLMLLGICMPDMPFRTAEQELKRLIWARQPSTAQSFGPKNQVGQKRCDTAVCPAQSAWTNILPLQMSF